MDLNFTDAELAFRAEIRTPEVPVTSAKLRAAGFAFAH